MRAIQRNTHSRILTAAAIVGMTTLAACGGSSDKSSSSTTTGGGVTVAPTEGTVITATLGDTKGTDAPMTMDISAATAKAGKITFKAKNEGTIKHEFVVLKVPAGQTWDSMPITSGKINEDSPEGTNVGEIGDVKVGETGQITLDMQPGDYLLVCNIKEHYDLGMRAQFTVTP